MAPLFHSFRTTSLIAHPTPATHTALDRLAAKLLSELSPGARVVSYMFRIAPLETHLIACVPSTRHTQPTASSQTPKTKVSPKPGREVANVPQHYGEGSERSEAPVLDAEGRELLKSGDFRSSVRGTMYEKSEEKAEA